MLLPIRLLLLITLVSLVCVLDGVGQSPAAPTSPAVEFQVVPARDNVGRGEPLTLYLYFTNKSNTTLTLTAITLSDQAFRRDEQAEQAQQAKPITVPTPLAPFSSVETRMVIKARDEAKYAQYKFPLYVDYIWEADGKSYASKQSATVTVELRRRFDEEAKGFPGGTAAFLYLLLPIVPALLSYQIVNALRKGEGFKAPTFGSEHIAPAFMLAVLISLFVLVGAKDDPGFDYSDPSVFLTVLIASAAAGAIVPALRWLWGVIKKKARGFKWDDSPQAYLKKALRQLDPGEQFRWVQGKAGGELWEGLLLKQPDGTNVVGIQLQVSPNYPVGADDAARAATWTALTTELVRADGLIVNSKELVRKVDEGELSVSPLAFINRGGRQLNTRNEVAWEVGGFVEIDGTSQPKPLVTPVQ